MTKPARNLFAGFPRWDCYMPAGSREKKPSNCLAHVWRANLPDGVLSAAWSADGTQFVAGVVSGSIHVFDACTGGLKHELPGHPAGLAAVAVHPAEPVVASAGHDGRIRVWNITTGHETGTLDAGPAWAEHVAWNAAGTLLASAAGKKVHVWSHPAGEMVREFGPFPSTVADVAWHPRDPLFAVAYYGGVNVYKPDADEPAATWPWKGSPLELAWSPSGTVLVHGNQDASVHFRYAVTGAELHMSGYPTKVRELSWDFRSRYLATGGGPGVCLWDCSGAGPEGQTPRILEGHAGNLAAVAWQRRGFLLASADVAGRLCVWQPANRTPLVGGATFSGTELTCLGWSPDDKMLAVGSSAGALAVFKVN